MPSPIPPSSSDSPQRVTMALHPIPLPSLLVLLLLLCTSLVDHSAGKESSTAAEACRTSVYPKFCRALLSPLHFLSGPFEYGHFSVKQALKQTQRTSRILDRYLYHRSRGHLLSDGAAEDCRELADLNCDFLSEVEDILSRGEAAMSPVEAGRVRTLMSAVVTNQQTCYDGLEAYTGSSGLARAVAGNVRLCGVSLELVSSAVEKKAAGGHVGAGGFHSDMVTERKQSQREEEDGNGIVPVSDSVVVAADGSRDFTSVADAIAFAPNSTLADDGYFAIYISEGIYNENVVVPKNKKNLILIGDGIDRTVITGNRSVRDGWTTFNSATFAVYGERFIATDITFENTAGPAKNQAVAVRNSADLSSFYRCSFLGYQDTLYTHSQRQFYRNCDIYGTVDFIFGNAASFFQNCNLFVRKPLPAQRNAITAQGRTHPNQTTGISIHNSSITAAPDLEAALNCTKTYLGRPWKEYSRTVYMQSFIDRLIDPVGWLEWNGSFALDTLYFGEFDNYGAGANTSGRVQWVGYSLMNLTQAFSFTLYNFTGGEQWLPSTSIPYSSGLI